MEKMKVEEKIEKWMEACVMLAKNGNGNGRLGVEELHVMAKKLFDYGLPVWVDVDIEDGKRGKRIIKEARGRVLKEKEKKKRKRQVKKQIRD